MYHTLIQDVDNRESSVCGGTCVLGNIQSSLLSDQFFCKPQISLYLYARAAITKHHMLGGLKV